MIFTIYCYLKISLYFPFCSGCLGFFLPTTQSEQELWRDTEFKNPGFFSEQTNFLKTIWLLFIDTEKGKALASIH